MINRATREASKKPSPPGREGNERKLGFAWRDPGFAEFKFRFSSGRDIADFLCFSSSLVTKVRR